VIALVKKKFLFNLNNSKGDPRKEEILKLD
jgi:hypothetical protein